MKTEKPKYQTRKALKEQLRQAQIQNHYLMMDLTKAQAVIKNAVRMLGA
jgi:hypothetical protein